LSGTLLYIHAYFVYKSYIFKNTHTNDDQPNFYDGAVYGVNVKKYAYIYISFKS